MFNHIFNYILRRKEKKINPNKFFKSNEDYPYWGIEIFKENIELFSGYEHTNYLHCYSFECQEGWRKLIAHLVRRLNQVSKYFYKHFGFYIIVSQIKEKFGTLHFYYDIAYINDWRTNLVEKYKPEVLDRIYKLLDKKAEKLIEQAEDMCYNICEECGKEIGTEESPRIETKGWIQYLCKDCAEKRK
jgi:RNA polymerase-binding transcription factor DksA